ncbi:MAG: (Fe-S)-binding protein [Anaerolineales bacterium]|nr:(Fe-S)-binding protein [Anaerolineales bacterium]
MALLERKSPKGKKASLFVTCMVDMMYPETAVSVVELLAHVGVEVEFPPGQTCCGQPGFNAGYWDEARQVAAQFLRAFAHAELIVTPSGSCAAMVRHEYPKLFADEPALQQEAERLASITWEITEFLVDGLGIEDINGRLPTPTTVAFHDACHGLRLLGLGQAARTLVGNLENATVSEMVGCDVCCGFGGLFSVKMADISGVMLHKKMTAVEQSQAQVVTGDASCLTHINGGLAKQGSPQRVRHVADVLAEAIRD